MKRISIFLSMFLFSILDLPWAIFNLFIGGSTVLFGVLLCKLGMKSMGETFKLYGLNIAISVDQFMAVKAMGQDPDVTISMALGVAKIKHENKTASVNKFWLIFGDFVNFLFSFQKDHVKESIEREEKAENTVISIYVEREKRQKDKLEDKFKDAA